MRTFAERSKAIKQNSSPGHAMSGRDDPRHKMGPIFHSERMTESQIVQRSPVAAADVAETAFGSTSSERPGHDFSSISVHANASEQPGIHAGGEEGALATWVQRAPADYTATIPSPAETTTQGSTFDASCNTVQQKLIDLVVTRTRQRLDTAIVRMLLLMTDVSQSTDGDYLRWFGTYDASRARYVIQTYRLISDALEKGVEFACDCSDNMKIYAYVFPGLKRRIHLCGLFWSAPYSGLNSKPGVIIHELAHEVLRGGDFHYSVPKAESLAVNFPWLAVRNADNIEYFAESV
jgi:hypothetical protein